MARATSSLPFRFPAIITVTSGVCDARNQVKHSRIFSLVPRTRRTNRAVSAAAVARGAPSGVERRVYSWSDRYVHAGMADKADAEGTSFPIFGTRDRAPRKGEMES